MEICTCENHLKIDFYFCSVKFLRKKIIAAIFYSVHSDGLSVEWDNEAALCPDTLYLNSDQALWYKDNTIENK